MHERRSIVLLTFVFSGIFGSSAQESTTIPVDGAVLHYRTYGNGEPLVIVGGIAGLSSDYLEPVAKELGKRFRCYLIDQRGTGRSDVMRLDTSTVNVRTVIGDIETLRRHLGISSWHVFGHAWGGAISITYGALYADVVTSLLLVGPAGVEISFLTHYGYNVATRMTAEDSAYYRTGNQYAAANRDRMNVVRFRSTLPSFVVNRAHVRAIEPFVTDETYRPQVSQTYWTAFMNRNDDFTQEFARRPVLTVIIQGDYDPVDMRTARKLETMIKGARLEVITKCGAFPWVENPKEFWRLVDNYKKRAASPSQRRR